MIMMMITLMTNVMMTIIIMTILMTYQREASPWRGRTARQEIRPRCLDIAQAPAQHGHGHDVDHDGHSNGDGEHNALAFHDDGGNLISAGFQPAGDLFKGFIDPSDQNERNHTPLLSKSDLNDRRRKIVRLSVL